MSASVPNPTRGSTPDPVIGLRSALAMRSLICAGTVRYGVWALILQYVRLRQAVLAVTMAVRCAAYVVNFVKMCKITAFLRTRCSSSLKCTKSLRRYTRVTRPHNRLARGHLLISLFPRRLRRLDSRRLRGPQLTQYRRFCFYKFSTVAPTFEHLQRAMIATLSITNKTQSYRQRFELRFYWAGV